MNKSYTYIIFAFFLMSCVEEIKKSNANSNIKEEYYSNGNIKVRVPLKNNIEHGHYYSFHNNGMIEKSGVVIKGKKNGLWKYSDSLGRVFAAKQYYNDSIVHNLDAIDFDYLNKKLDKNIEIKIPKKWTVVNDFVEKPILLVLRKECKKTVSFCPNLTITYESSIIETEQDKYIKKSNEILKSNFKNYRVIKERKYFSNGITYYEKIYTGNSKDINIGGITTWIFSSNKTYIITGLALNEKDNPFLKYEGLFKDITNSLDLLE